MSVYQRVANRFFLKKIVDTHEDEVRDALARFNSDPSPGTAEKVGEASTRLTKEISKLEVTLYHLKRIQAKHYQDFREVEDALSVGDW